MTVLYLNFMENLILFSKIGAFFNTIKKASCFTIMNFFDYSNDI